MGRTTFEFLPSTRTESKKTIRQQRVIRKKAHSNRPIRPIKIEVTPKVPDDLKGKHLDEKCATVRGATELTEETSAPGESHKAFLHNYFAGLLKGDSVKSITVSIEHTRPNGDFAIECVSWVLSKKHVADYVAELQNVATELVHELDDGRLLVVV